MNWNQTITAILLAGSAALAGAETAPTIAAATTPTNIDGKKRSGLCLHRANCRQIGSTKNDGMYGFVGTTWKWFSLKSTAK